jgi:hypothetical protein
MILVTIHLEIKLLLINIYLGDGRGMANGFYQALFLTQCGPTLNINLAFTCFYMPLNFVEFATKYLRKDITKGLSEGELQGFKRMVRNMLSM